MLDDKGVFHWKQPVSLYFSFSLVEGIKPIEIRLKKKGKSLVQLLQIYRSAKKPEQKIPSSVPQLFYKNYFLEFLQL